MILFIDVSYLFIDPYELEDLSRLTSHLSNHCLQEEFSQDYGKYEPNNEIFFSQFERYYILITASTAMIGLLVAD